MSELDKQYPKKSRQKIKKQKAKVKMPHVRKNYCIAKKPLVSSINLKFDKCSF